MADVVNAILPEVRTALSGIPGGTVRKGMEAGQQPVPSWWFRDISSARLNRLQDAYVPELHIWAKTSPDMESYLSAVEHLRDFRVAGVTYERQSIAKDQEDVSVFHAVVTWAAVAFVEVVV